MAPVKELKWLITGADGQLGRTMVDQLTSLGIENYPLNRNQLDITDEDAIEQAFRELKPDIVFNTAAWTNVDGAETSPHDAQKINSDAPGFLARASKKINAKFIHISTDYVFSGDAIKPWAENAKRSPSSVYGTTKAQGEINVLTEYPESSYIVRTAWLYSEYGNNFVKKIVQKALNETSEVRIVSDQVGQPTSAVDLAKQIIAMVPKDVSAGIYHGTNGGEASWFELTQEIFTLLGQDIERVIPIRSSELNQKVIRPKYSVLSHENWQKEGMQVMSPWKNALEEALPSIVKAIQEGK